MVEAIPKVGMSVIYLLVLININWMNVEYLNRINAMVNILVTVGLQFCVSILLYWFIYLSYNSVAFDAFANLIRVTFRAQD